ncbi:MAG: FecR domain-containing protein [Magnetococcus sp. WYHC-3]
MKREDLIAYVDGALSAAEVAELESELQGRPDLAQELAKLCRQRFMIEVHFASKTAVTIQQRPVEIRPARWWFVPLAAAASVAIVVGGVWLSLRTAGAAEPLGLRVAEVSGEWSVVSGQWLVGGGKNIRHAPSTIHPPSETRAVVGMEIRQGERVVVKEGKVRLKYDGEETTIELRDATEAAFGSDKSGKRVMLDGGTLVCAAAPQQKSFEIKTRHATLRVVGTQFSLTAEAVKTTLAVMEGKVDLVQGEKILQVSAGQEGTASDEGMKIEPAKADAAGLEKSSRADAWIRELLARAESGSWEALDFGTGLLAKNDWRVDARGGAAERRVWNTQVFSKEASLFVFDKKHWKRGVLVGRMMLLPDGKQPDTPPSPTASKSAAWSTGRVPVSHSLADGGYLHLSQGAVNIHRTPESFGRHYYEGLLSERHPRGVWHRFALYFDTEVRSNPLFMCASWPDDRADPPPGSAWNVVRHPIVLGVDDDMMELRVGIAAKGVLLVAQGLKFVPLGSELPPAPDEVGGWTVLKDVSSAP